MGQWEVPWQQEQQVSLCLCPYLEQFPGGKRWLPRKWEWNFFDGVLLALKKWEMNFQWHKNQRIFNDIKINEFQRLVVEIRWFLCHWKFISLSLFKILYILFCSFFIFLIIFYLFIFTTFLEIRWKSFIFFYLLYPASFSFKSQNKINYTYGGGVCFSCIVANFIGVSALKDVWTGVSCDLICCFSFYPREYHVTWRTRLSAFNRLTSCCNRCTSSSSAFRWDRSALKFNILGSAATMKASIWWCCSEGLTLQTFKRLQRHQI